MKYLLSLFTILTLSSCGDDGATLPEGIEWIARDGRTHFVFVDEQYNGDKVAQRKAGKTVCTRMFKHEDYCEVYMWSKRADIPRKLPLINRKTIIGKFSMKGEDIKLKALRD